MYSSTFMRTEYQLPTYIIKYYYKQYELLNSYFDDIGTYLPNVV